MSLIFKLGPTSATAITIYPSWDMSKGREMLASRLRTRSGRGYVYVWGTYNKLKLPLDFVSQANASIVNSWWETQLPLRLFVTSDGATSCSDVTSVRITGDSQPFTVYQMPYTEYYQGTIELEGY